MKFLMPKAELSDLVNGVQNIVAPRTPMPVLANILLEASENELVVTTTDLTVGVRAKAKAQVMEPGSTTLPARRLAQLLREISSSYVEVTTNAKEVTQIAADSSIFRMNGLSPVDYPTLPDFHVSEKAVIAEKDLKAALFSCSFAAAKEDARYVLTGVLLSLHEKTMLFVGTDGKRLARTAVSVECSEDLTRECIIPFKAIDELQKNLSDSDEEAVIYFMEDKIAIEIQNRVIVSKLLTGDFPDIDRIIPRKLTCVIPLQKDELSALLRQVSLFTSEDNQPARFSFVDSTLNLFANTADIGEGAVSMTVVYQGPRIDISFNPVSFLDILRHTSEEYVYLGLQDAFNPAVITTKEMKKTLDELPSPLFVLMPMRLSEG